MRLGAAALEVVDMVQEAGIPNATADGRDLDLPGALVTPETVSCDRMGGDYTVVWNVYLIAGDHGAVEALDDLGDMFDTVKDELGVADARPVTMTLPNLAADPLPALTFTLTTNITD